MYHFFVDKNQLEKENIIIQGIDVNHIKNVLRMKPGMLIRISLREDTSRDYICELEQLQEDYIRTRIIEIDEDGTELPSKIYLFQGLPKGDKMELIIQKTVELGVFEIIPVATKRSVMKLDHKKEENKLKRWQMIAESAAKQSKRRRIPSIKKVMTMKEAIEYAEDFDVKLIPYENTKGMDETKRILNQLKPETKIGIFIGPEGGFEDTEVELAVAQDFMPISLGKRILRTETAGLALIAAMMFELEH
ncbi:16S rRNA (uracil(1498)-N(3))-methyltransferase [Anaerosacchariphilus polymeriproducens]|uniref:Ribosomal RNA small subunit methyltransferase E n=1 Tax=Anaerosacchariphilus polymeriproducens TaxID=1812858 RepID=A0A371ASC3_9FIRM|nr:16S rRNA (uracil(1498)-N(3))-methyltransferase [Anaerosacchariphilus polymeriproducens]RDU22459.1 16S rRNA (uracil(1498)-N(3))-methyltransferase [Anaerosacchariphilus polymeriproducens]